MYILRKTLVNHYLCYYFKDVVQKLKDIGHPMVRLKNIAVAAASGIAISSSGMIEAMPDFRRLGNTSGY